MSKLDDISQPIKMPKDEFNSNDYIVVSKQQIKELMLEIIGDNYDTNMVHVNMDPTWWDAVNARLRELRQKVEEL